jgi:hypothetical protein
MNGLLGERLAESQYLNEAGLVGRHSRAMLTAVALRHDWHRNLDRLLQQFNTLP